jgi:hypothetical protein
MSFNSYSNSHVMQNPSQTGRAAAGDACMRQPAVRSNAMQTSCQAPNPPPSCSGNASPDQQTEADRVNRKAPR